MGNFMLLTVFDTVLDRVRRAVQKRERGGDEREKIVVEPNLTVVRIFENIGIQTAGGRILNVIFLRTVFVVAC